MLPHPRHTSMSRHDWNPPLQYHPGAKAVRGNPETARHLPPDTSYHVTNDVMSVLARCFPVPLPHHLLTSPPCQRVVHHVTIHVDCHVIFRIHFAPKIRHVDVIPEKCQNVQKINKNHENDYFCLFSIVRPWSCCMRFYIQITHQPAQCANLRIRLHSSIPQLELYLLNCPPHHKTRYLPAVDL